jgi:hypothetical protein
MKKTLILVIQGVFCGCIMGAPVLLAGLGFIKG